MFSAEFSVLAVLINKCTTTLTHKHSYYMKAVLGAAQALKHTQTLNTHLIIWGLEDITNDPK